jgi:hypothetical protein
MNQGKGACDTGIVKLANGAFALQWGSIDEHGPDEGPALPLTRHEQPLTRREAFAFALAITTDSKIADEFQPEIADLWG